MTSIFLTFFKVGILFDELLLTIAGEADRELGLVTRAFPAQYQAPAILCMANIGSGQNVAAGNADKRGPGRGSPAGVLVPVRIERIARTVSTPSRSLK